MFFSQPKLSAAKCRRNVDNFLAACRKIGVREVSDQFEQKQLLQLIFTFRLSMPSRVEANRVVGKHIWAIGKHTFCPPNTQTSICNFICSPTAFCPQCED